MHFQFEFYHKTDQKVKDVEHSR